MKISLLPLAALVVLLPLRAAAQAPNAPFAGARSMTTDQALKQAPKLDPALVPLDKSFQTAEAKYKKSPKDASVKKAYVESAYTYGHTVMLDRGKGLSPSVQYRAALALYRKALAVDPKHKPSLDDKNMIEGIYKQMGISIPK